MNSKLKVRKQNVFNQKNFGSKKYHVKNFGSKKFYKKT